LWANSCGFSCQFQMAAFWVMMRGVTFSPPSPFSRLRRGAPVVAVRYGVRCPLETRRPAACRPKCGDSASLLRVCPKQVQRRVREVKRHRGSVTVWLLMRPYVTLCSSLIQEQPTPWIMMALMRSHDCSRGRCRGADCSHLFWHCSPVGSVSLRSARSKVVLPSTSETLASATGNAPRYRAATYAERCCAPTMELLKTGR